MTPIAKQALKIGHAFDDLADALKERARTLLQEGAITKEQFRDVSKSATKVRQRAVAIRNRASSEITAETAIAIRTLKDSTAELMKATKQIKKVGAITVTAVKIATSAVLVASAVFSPNPVSIGAAVTSLLDASESILGVAGA